MRRRAEFSFAWSRRLRAAKSSQSWRVCSGSCRARSRASFADQWESRATAAAGGDGAGRVVLGIQGSMRREREPGRAEQGQGYCDADFGSAGTSASCVGFSVMLKFTVNFAASLTVE